MPDSDPTATLLRWQFDVIWALAEYHLDRWTADDPLWVPAARHWTVHRGADGRWVPDWAEVEPDPPPVPTGAWVGWHVLWWWGTALDELTGRPHRDRTAVEWPGDADAAVAALRDLAARWRAAVTALDADAAPQADAAPKAGMLATPPSALDRPVSFPWPSGHTVAHLLAWVNVELTKNVAELGQLALLRRASG